MLIARIFAQARAFPDKPAFIHNGVICTYAAFARRIAAAHRLLSTRRLRSGSVAVLCMASHAEAWVWGIAVRRLGLVTVVAESLDQLRGTSFNDVSCFMTSAGEPPHPELGAWLAGKAIDDICLPASADLDMSIELASPVSTVRPAGHIQLTSGTTGTSKKIMRDALDEERGIDMNAGVYGISAASVVYLRDFPLSTAGGFRWPLMCWLQGATVIFQQWRDFHLPHLRYELTDVFATPSVLSWLTGRHGNELHRDERVRLFVVAGALPRALAAAIKERLGWQILILLGSTEAKTISLTPVETLEDLNWHRIFPWRVVQVVDDAGRPIAHGEVGLVRIKIDDDVTGYLDDAAVSAAFFRDGYFYPGDLGTFNPDGRLALLGRVNDVINIQGGKIATAPIEQAMQEQLGAETVCVLSMQGQDGDEEVHVAIQSRTNFSRTELEKMTRASPLGVLPKVQYHLMEELPRNAMGKVLRLELQRKIREQLARDRQY